MLWHDRKCLHSFHALDGNETPNSLLMNHHNKMNANE
jgi:hypothetical protein